MMNRIKILIGAALALMLLLGGFTSSVPVARAAGGGCPAMNAIGNFKNSNDGLAASFGLSDPGNVGYNTLATYIFTSNNESPTDGVPGLIEYCVYPSQPPGNADSAVALYDSWTNVFGAIQGFFAFKRPDGNPSNLPFDGSTQIIGTATWSAGAPTNQTILLHINDADECAALYNDTTLTTCFVFPGSTPPPPCLGTPACKTVVIDEAIDTSPLTVPANTLLHIHYTYTIVNQAGNTFNMVFNKPLPSTQDINTGGGKDYFGCEQQPDPNGQPGKWGTYPNYQSTGFQLAFQSANGGGCPQSRFFLTNQNTTPIVLMPGQSIQFTVDMVTRTNKGGNQEYTSCGLHLLNSGFTVKWIQSDDGLLHSYSTNVNPIYVNVVGCN